MYNDTVVIKLGGSLIAPESKYNDGIIDIEFVSGLKNLLDKYKDTRFIIVGGGGYPCRVYQKAAEKLNSNITKHGLDMIGIRTTQLTQALLEVFGEEAYENVVFNPFEEFETDKKYIFASGYKPGSSSDLRAVQLGVRLGFSSFIKMSNIEYVYSADPKTDPNAEKIVHMNWAEYIGTFGSKEWIPGLNIPFDPSASEEAEKHKIKVVIAGKSLDNLENFLNGADYKGTTID